MESPGFVGALRRDAVTGNKVLRRNYDIPAAAEVVEVRFVRIINQPCNSLFSFRVRSVQCNNCWGFAFQLEWNSQIGARSLALLNRVADQFASVAAIDIDRFMNLKIEWRLFGFVLISEQFKIATL